ncbi:hypothetical protein BDN72DRAFT_904321 [Pluteus cervinus]|uniref:Uncharacterized protein n=1 Tax=Pluteus cervinus TaxID=181527 RepID=A0ACD3A5L9_9AGAR|nr:hypothetical protein BDN72DRAFT_904321 [Pluteus cervinus]
MGRRSKHNNPDEKKAADCIKNQRSYWENQDHINARRRERYRQDSQIKAVMDTYEREGTAIVAFDAVESQFRRFFGRHPDFVALNTNKPSKMETAYCFPVLFLAWS